MGFAAVRAQARQLVSHGHFAVNGRPDATSRRIPAASPATRRGAREPSRAASPSRSIQARRSLAQTPDWLTVDADKLAGTVVSLPRRDQMPLELNEQLVVEYYSR